MHSTFCVAVLSLLYLNQKGCFLSSEELAGKICTNPARIRKIMSSLRKAGLIETRGGSDGGYRFVLDPRSVNLAQVASALDYRFVKPALHGVAPDERDCIQKTGMAGIMLGLFDDLDQCCRQRLSQITIADLNHQITQ